MQAKTAGKSWVPAVLNGLNDQLSKALTFIFSVAMAYDTSILVRLHANNPYNISNIHNAAEHWGPETNYARVIYIIVASVAFYIFLRWINRRSCLAFRLIIAAFVALNLLVGFMIPQATGSMPDLMFVNGETLAPTNGYLHGKALFTNIFFLHGAGIDVLIPRVSYALLSHGRQSIGAATAFLDLIQALSIFLFVVVLARLFRPAALFLLVTAWFLGTNYSGFDYAKDIPVYLVVLMYWYWLNRPFVLKWRLALLGAIGLISSASLLYSIDVGFIMTLIAVVLGVGLLFIEQRADRLLAFRRLPRQLSHWYESFALAAGVLVGQLGILLFLGSRSYGNFFHMTFLQIPKYQGLEWDYPLPALGTSTWTFWLPILVAGIAAYMLLVVIVNQLRKNRRLSRETAYALILAALGILYLRFGIGRPDEPHIDVSVPLLFVASFYIMRLYASRYNVDKQWNIWPIGLYLAVLLCTIPQPTWSPLNMFAAGNTTFTQLRNFKALPSQPDRAFLTKNEIDVTKYITNHTKPSDGIFVMDPEPLYYKLADRPNPTRFYITWFADPQPYTTEMLNSLKKNPPKLVVFSGPSPYENSDGVPLNQRIPEVTSWVTKNYPVKTVIDKNTVILSRQ